MPKFKFAVDHRPTKEICDKVEFGNPEECGSNDCKIDLGGGSTFDTAKVGDDFEIAFTKASDLTFFDKETFNFRHISIDDI